MRSIKKVLALAFSFVLLLATAALASEAKVGTFNEMSLEKMSIKEQGDWITENVKPEYYQGIRKEINQGDVDIQDIGSGWIYTKIHFTDVSSTAEYLGRVRTQMQWTVDANKKITNYGTTLFQVTKASSTVIVNKESFGYYPLPDNYRHTYRVSFTDVMGYHLISQVYNLMGDGTYVFRVF